MAKNNQHGWGGRMMGALRRVFDRFGMLEEIDRLSDRIEGLSDRIERFVEKSDFSGEGIRNATKRVSAAVAGRTARTRGARKGTAKRAVSPELSAKKSAAGKKGAAARWGKIPKKGATGGKKSTAAKKGTSAKKSAAGKKGAAKRTSTRKATHSTSHASA
jgi:hypothetical protein